jgi:hypothetical protein
MTESLCDLLASSRARIAALRQSGDLRALVAAAEVAADAIEQRVVVGAALSDADQQALLAVKRFTYSAAADCWPGWSVSSTWVGFVDGRLCGDCPPWGGSGECARADWRGWV